MAGTMPEPRMRKCRRKAKPDPLPLEKEDFDIGIRARPNLRVHSYQTKASGFVWEAGF